MLEGFPRVDTSRTAFRLASLPSDEQFVAELGLGRQGRRELVELLAEPGNPTQFDELLDGPFRRKRKAYPSRFSDGSFPVLYTALEAATAEAETEHWFPTRIGRPRVPRTVYYSLFSCRFSGTEIDLRPKISEWPDLIHADDYSLCNRIGAEARRLELDGLVTRSARCKDGTNLPVFTRAAVGQPEPEGLVAMTYDPDTGKVSVRHVGA